MITTIATTWMSLPSNEALTRSAFCARSTGLARPTVLTGVNAQNPVNK
jgi:hypothetical protein